MNGNYFLNILLVMFLSTDAFDFEIDVFQMRKLRCSSLEELKALLPISSSRGLLQLVTLPTAHRKNCYNNLALVKQM